MLGTPKYHHNNEDIEINANRAKVTLQVANTGDRAIQIGSHFHFFEVNRALRFDREKAYGMHLDLPAGTGVRIEAGDTREVTLAAYGGGRRVIGFNNLVDGGLDSRQTRLDAMRRLAEGEFQNGAPATQPSDASHEGDH
ncbi:urease subunit beta [Cellulomonas chengniuliangii]|uniref:Urease subunit beta n=1 Tax=Cellulomonas chengniuliangii TaxID=2968084 RepID=A0ABY5L162_9CELL|nr:urease subunit beta [Cellulomonas chengniuliangii]MCC2307567.1 urease subunit beta [Cellulomonas chengniuliangii]MCC2318679.1 urease subunit beta [Cellulomonas chengniuliangii]UUI75663.1 urease subunit beta [Cellulomonas chengniuliangii]